jgi:hypothetical protein
LMENFYLFIFFGAVFKIFLPFVVCLFVEWKA